MAPTPTEPDWPLRFVTAADGSVALAETLQGEDRAREARAAVVLCTPKGHRDDAPAFGVTTVLWAPGPINTERLAAELNASDLSLDVTAAESYDLADAGRRRLSVDVGHAA